MSAATAYARILDALGEHGSTVRANGTTASAQCPAHEDRNPSLSVRAIEGSVLLHDHAGCRTDDVLAALELSTRDLYDEPGGARYDYTDRGGTVLRSVHRTPDKRFRQSGDTKGAAPLYRLPAVAQAVAQGTTVHVVEGESDVLALESLGAVATTSPMGASNAHRADWSPLHGAHVVLVPDRDDAGQRYCRDVLQLLDGKAASVKIMLPKVGKDAADHVAAGHTLDELEAAELPEPEVAPVALLKIRRGDELVLRRVRYLWQARIPLGAVTLMPGEEGIGKSTLNARLAADVTRGTLPGEMYGKPASVLIIAPEDHVEAVVAPRLVEAGADMSRVIFVDARLDVGGIEHDIVLPRDLPALVAMIEAEGVALVVIDSLVTTLPDELKSTAYKDMATVLKRLGSFAEDTDVAVLAPWHLNKSSGSDTALRMMDSRALRTATRSVLLVVGDPEKPGEGLVALDKSNGGTLDVPALRYRLRSAPYLVTEVDETTGEVTEHTATCAVADWIGEEPGDGRQTARDLLMPAMERDDDPVVWLRRYLTDAGETAKQVVISAGAEAGFGERALQRAAQRLRVVYRDVTEDRPGSTPLRRVAWRLPDGRATDDARSRHVRESVTTVATEALGGVLLSSSSQVRDGRDGHDGREDVRESGATAGTTESSHDTTTQRDLLSTPPQDWTAARQAPRPPAHCVGCNVELTPARAGRNLRCEPCWTELLANQPEAAS